MKTWWWKADYYETCNCAYGCPCNLSFIPTDGTCKAIDVWDIKEGAMNELRLDGLVIALLVCWPNPIHEGNGKAIIYIDERANSEQRKALASIGVGEAGPGGPFAIFATTFAKIAHVIYGPVLIERLSRKKASIKLGRIASLNLSPILSAMDGAEASARMILPNGFIWQDSEMVNTDYSEVNTENFAFVNKNTSAFISTVKYNC
jgi:hypothetical protein